MSSPSCSAPSATHALAASPARETAEDFQRYYEEAGPDYAAWSPAFNMHFGWWKRGLNPFRRESLLEEMNAQVLSRLQNGPAPPRDVLDMGCGLGATLRSFSRRLPPGTRLHGITLVPWQQQQGCALNQAGAEATAATRRIQLDLVDYQNTGLPSESFDGVLALESSCYARGADKADLLQEAHRLLRPGGRLVLADAFLPSAGRLSAWQSHVCRKLCQCWVIDALGELDLVTAQLTELGFRDIRVEPAQWRVAVSVAHVPWVTLRFLLSDVAFGHRDMTRARWNNVLAPLLLPWVSYPLGPLAYFLVTATR